MNKPRTPIAFSENVRNRCLTTARAHVPTDSKLTSSAEDLARRNANRQLRELERDAEILASLGVTHIAMR